LFIRLFQTASNEKLPLKVRLLDKSVDANLSSAIPQ